MIEEIEHLAKEAEQEDKEKVYDALKQGRSFIAYDYLHPANGFRFQCIHRDFTLEMGEESTYQPGLQLEIQVPFEADIRLIRNGGELMRTTGRELVVPANGSGVYRVEAYMEQKPWIFSNPIYIREAANV